MQVVKRDGVRKDYNSSLILKAVFKAAQSTGMGDYDCHNLATLIEDKVNKKLKGRKEAPVSEIQDDVEKSLMVTKHKDVAIAYIEFRHDRDRVRELDEDLFKDVEALIYRDEDSDLLSENANKDSRIIPTIKSLVAESVGKHYAKKYMLPKHVVDAHDKGEIHFHDAGEMLYPMFNCMLVDLATMLRDGFNMGNASIEQPNSILTACSIAAQVVTAVGSHIYGGNTLPDIDLTLAPYVTKTYNKHLKEGSEFNISDVETYAKTMTLRDTKAGIQALYYQLNTIISTQGQTVFCTLTCGEGTSWEERLIQECVLRQQMEGLGKERTTFVFPKLVFQVKKGVNFEEVDPNYDMLQLAAECSAKRLYPDILFMDTLSEKQKTKAKPMGCRAYLQPYFNDQGEEVYYGRNNMGVVSLGLVRIALEAKKDANTFWKLLDERCEVAHDALRSRIDRLSNVKASVAPILYCSGAMGIKLKPEDNVIDIMKDGRSSISLGYIGIHEAVYAMFGEDILGKHEEFALDIVKFLSKKTSEWKDKEGYGYSVYSSPGESLCYRFCALDTKDFGIIEGVTDKGYYTNSFHRTVEDPMNVFDKAKFESPYTEYAVGGFISYGEYPSMVGKEDALISAWKEVSKYQSYYGTNLPSDNCFKCGYKGEFKATEEGFVCPTCGNNDEHEMSCIRRVTGYLSSLGSRPVNKGKHKEMQRRVKHW